MLNVTSAHCRLVGAIGARILCGCLLLLGPALGTAFAAGVILDSGGFESPFEVGPLQGQLGWLVAGSGLTSATVQSSVVHSGSQAVLVTRSANSDKRWADPQTGFPTQRFVTVDWDMRVSQPSNLTAFGPFFGVDAYDDEGTFGQLGSFGVDATTGEVLFQLQDNGAITAAPATVLFNEWYHYRMVLDFGTDTYRGYVNGELLATTGFVDRSSGLDDFSDADIAAFAAAPDPVSDGLSASAVFDNFVIRDGLVGDYDIDGDVDPNDYTRWRATFGTAVAPAGNDADGNSNGVVDAADYVLWRNNNGTSLFSGAGTGSGLPSAGVVVPEPASTMLVLLGLPAFLGRASRWRRFSP